MIKKIYKRLNSTNIKARQLLDKGEINDSVWIQAEDQYSGKGLGENIWESEQGKNITGSLVIFPASVSAENQFDLSIVTSLAVCDLLELFLGEVKIKWPNDIYVGTKKIAGLLVEHTLMGQEIKHSVLGIGLNINQETFQESIPNPISLKQLLGIEIDLEEVTDLLLNCLSLRLDQLEAGQAELMRGDYLNKLFRYREYAPYKAHNKWFRARIVGISKFGQLILETEKGEHLEFGFKEVEFIDD